MVLVSSVLNVYRTSYSNDWYCTLRRKLWSHDVNFTELICLAMSLMQSLIWFISIGFFFLACWVELYSFIYYILSMIRIWHNIFLFFMCQQTGQMDILMLYLIQIYMYLRYFFFLNMLHEYLINRNNKNYIENILTNNPKLHEKQIENINCSYYSRSVCIILSNQFDKYSIELNWLCAIYIIYFIIDKIC